MSAEALSHKDFILAWQTSTTMAEVEERTKMSFKRASNRAVYLRKMGIKLKKFDGRQKINVAELQEFLASLG